MTGTDEGKVLLGILDFINKTLGNIFSDIWSSDVSFTLKR